MNKPIQRVFILGNFVATKPRACGIEPRILAKGLVRHGVDVHTFSYRDVLEQERRFRIGKLGLKQAHAATEALLLTQIRVYHPELILVIGGKGFSAKTVEKIRTVAPGVPIVGREADPRPEADRHRTEIGRACDFLLTIDSGEWMEYYKNLGIKTVAFFPFSCDPDLQHP